MLPFLLLLAASPAPAATPETAPLSVRALPDTVFQDQTGAERRFADLVKGRLVALNFIFTSCTTICPPMGAAFAALQTLEAARGVDVQFLSVSIDPTTDTPQRLDAWARKFGGTAAWTLLTGPSSGVNALLDAFGVGGVVRGEHAPVVVLGNARAGRWVRAHALAPPAELAALLDDLRSQR